MPAAGYGVPARGFTGVDGPECAGKFLGQVSYNFRLFVSLLIHLTDANIESNGRATQRTKFKEFSFANSVLEIKDIRRKSCRMERFVWASECHCDGSWQTSPRKLAGETPGEPRPGIVVRLVRAVLCDRPVWGSAIFVIVTRPFEA